METNTVSYQFHTSTVDAWENMLQRIDEAEHSIWLEEYVIDPDTIGGRFTQALEKKAKQGLEVRLIGGDAKPLRHLMSFNDWSNLVRR